MDAKGKRVCKLINGIVFQSNFFQDDSAPPAALIETDNGNIYDPKCITQLNDFLRKSHFQVCGNQKKTL